MPLLPTPSKYFLCKQQRLQAVYRTGSIRCTDCSQLVMELKSSTSHANTIQTEVGFTQSRPANYSRGLMNRSTLALSAAKVCDVAPCEMYIALREHTHFVAICDFKNLHLPGSKASEPR